MVDFFERDVPPHPFSYDRLGEGAWAVQHQVRVARLRDLGDGADMGKVHISTCLCCSVEPVQCQYYPGGLLFWPNFWMLLVPIHLLCPCAEARMCW